MFRTNGGLLGVRRTTNLADAPGVWSLVEQGIGQQANTWPIPGPIASLSPVLWYDFADEATVTVASSQITQVADKGSRNWTLTKSTTGPAYTSGINGRKCVDWGAAGHLNFLRNTSTTSTAIGEIYIVLDANLGNTFPDYYGLVSETTNKYYAIGRLFASGFDNMNEVPAHNQAFINASTTNVYASGVLPAVNSPSILRLNRSDGNAYTSTNGFQIGNDRNYAASGYTRGWGGLIGEVVVFSAQLSGANRTTVLNWLSAKWGIPLA